MDLYEPKCKVMRTNDNLITSVLGFDLNSKVTYTNENGEKNKSHFTGRDSCVPITFPYTPTRVYEEWIE